MDIQYVLTVIAGILFLEAFIPYILTIMRGETQPAKGSWLVWASLDSITITGMFFKHTVNGQIIGAVYVLCHRNDDGLHPLHPPANSRSRVMMYEAGQSPAKEKPRFTFAGLFMCF